MTAKRQKPKTDQHKAFVDAAKELGCDVSEASFDKTLKKIGMPSGKPTKAKPRP
jgi:hypothetical protein